MGPAIVLFAQTAIFWIRHRNVDEDAYMTYDDDEEDVTSEAPLKAQASSEGAEPVTVVSEKKQ